jgi:hypothetical protein|tara:strand:- start:282 stop:677 length:396 start_codon:yes stop_codon:yes gene_type:complete
MSTVQETNRYQRAIRAIAQREQVTTYAIIEWLKKHEGVGCSMREASNELQAWRAMQEQDLDIAADIAALGLLAATSGLTRDGRARVITRLRQRRAFDWKKLGGSTNEAAEKAAQRLREALAILPQLNEEQS